MLKDGSQMTIGALGEATGVGPDTIRTAATAGVDLIAVEAGKTLILGRDDVLKLCAELKVGVIALA